MGSMFTNVHVSGGEDPEATRAKVLAAVRRRGGDRCTLVGPAGPWIVVYDSVIDTQDVRALENLGAALSKAAGTHAVTILMHDSSHLLVGLFRAGKVTARYNAEHPVDAPDLAPWRPVLARGAEGAFADLLASDELDADATFDRVVELLGLDPARAYLGFRYATSDDDVELDGFDRVDGRVAPTPSAGPPSFVGHGFTPESSTFVGREHQISASVRNEGGASAGVDVIVKGDTLGTGVVPLRAQLVVMEAGQMSHVETTLEPRDGAWVARFADARIPAGVPGDFLGGVVHANVYVDVRERGEHRVAIGFVPHAAPTMEVGVHMNVRATAAPHRPLRADGRDHSLQSLAERTTLFGLVSFTASAEAAAPIAARAIERWGTTLAGDPWSLALFPGGLTKRVRTDQHAAAGFFASKRWTKLQRDLATAACVAGELGERAFMKPLSGFAFGGSVLRMPPPDGERELTSLSLYRSDDADASALLVELLDDVAARAGVVQGAIGRWGWQPSTFGATPYETVCGIHGDEVLYEGWQSRWLRAVTDDWIWLGPSLLAHLDRAALAGVAEIVPLGEAVRIRATADLAALEAVLAPILPSADDARGAPSRFPRPSRRN
jgi:hypothetical protein